MVAGRAADRAADTDRDVAKATDKAGVTVPAPIRMGAVAAVTGITAPAGTAMGAAAMKMVIGRSRPK